jgi:hypothetical protein
MVSASTQAAGRPALRFAVPAVFAGFILLAVLANITIWKSPLTMHRGGTVDPQEVMWFINWPTYALSHHRHPLLSSYINYPNGVNLLWNATMPVLAVLLWPVTSAWGAIASYNVITTAGMALAGCFGFLAIRRYVPATLAAAAGGLVFGFSPAIIAQQGHPQVAFSAVTIPLALLALDELLVRQRLPVWLLGVMIGALGIFQFFVFEEFFVTELMFAAVVAVILAVMHRDQIRRRLPYAARALGVGAALTAAVVAYPFLGIQLGGPDQARGLVHDPNLFSTDLLNPALPTKVQLIAPGWATSISRSFSSNGTEADGYLGLPLLVVFIFTAWRYWKVTAIRVAGIAAIIITVLSLGPHLHVAGHDTGIPAPWRAVSWLPFIRDILPSRMMSAVFLAAGLSFAFALTQIGHSSSRRVLASALLAAAVFTCLSPHLPLPASKFGVPSYFSTADVQEIPIDAVTYTIPFPTANNVDPLSWQIASAMRFKLLGGGNFLGPIPLGQNALRQVAAAFASGRMPIVISRHERALFLKELRTNHVQVVIVGPIRNQAAAAVFCTHMLGFAPHVSDGIDVWILTGRQ